jgi:hypothetical protein
MLSSVPGDQRDLGARIEQLLLERGLEDWIPLPEAAQSVRQILARSNPVPAMADALRRLLDQERIQISRGQWDDHDPPRVPDDEARRLLTENGWYQWHLEDDAEIRLWFVNVENIREP